MRFSLALVLALTAAGCGQTGSLYLPDEDVETPVEIRAPEEEDEDEKATQPPGR